ncbi:hypothetical protein [Chryseobacterium sp. JAH]|uniref:hypothetical protein n=1 Tax=Chryseobacterium sp. JAH TaxID=1742858 RepID=UPI0007410156|nr:hypothetical protein [Chryseobacterium sp. JAH]KUJ51974.1 hypothetical protein AR685_10120 [Chryseobacterium sp. JAH]
MKTKFLILISFLYPLLMFSQKIKVIDAENQKPIPYAKLILKDKDYYKNTEENGETLLDKGEEISEIQSFGYENFRTEKYQSVYLLKPKFIEIAEVEIVRPKFQKAFKLGIIKNNSMGFSASTMSWVVVDLFKADVSNEKLFIKKIRIPTKVEKAIKEATFNLVFYDNEGGKPSKDKVNSILVTCKSGKNITEIDLSKTPIQFPKNGFFIGFEWIVNEQNKFTYITDIKYPDGKRLKNVMQQGIAPKFQGYESEASNIFSFSGNLQWKNILNKKKINNSNYSLCIELELAN